MYKFDSMRTTMPSSSTPQNVASTSSSSTSEALNVDLLDSVMRHVVRSCPINTTMRLKNVHPIGAAAIRHGLEQHTHIRLAILEPQRCKVDGGKLVSLPKPLLNVYIQGSRMSSEEEAVQTLKGLLNTMREVSSISLELEHTDGEIVASLMSMLINADNVKLRVLQCKRREGGKTLGYVAQLIRKNEDTLRIIGRIGITEAIESFSPKIRLERLSLMTLDLAYDPCSAQVIEAISQLHKKGATFRHLSFTSQRGFDPANETIQDFLEECGVCSLRLTMNAAPFFSQIPDYMIGKVRGIDHLEIGEVVPTPTHYNRLMVHEGNYRKVFPNVGHITFFQSW